MNVLGKVLTEGLRPGYGMGCRIFLDDQIEILNPRFQAAREFETRVGEVISLDHFTHLQVPYRNISQVANIVMEAGVNLPVVAIEFVELILSERSLMSSSRRGGFSN